MQLNLNSRAWQICRQLETQADELRIQRHDVGGATVWDLGIDVAGGLDAGLNLARICLAGLGHVALRGTPGVPGTGWSVEVNTDQPVAACMASQYAGWKIAGDAYFAMGSGPMRALAKVEELFQRIPGESAEVAVGVLEAGALPPPTVVQNVADRCGVSPDRLTLLVAPTASQAGNLQIVARSVETTIHKLLDLSFDLERIVSGAGTAPLPPVAANDLRGIGRTNDAILYGAQVTLWLRGDDATLEEIAPRIPSCASPDYGAPFAEVFARYNHDFYQIDPHLFSPAEVCLINLDTGHSFRAGRVKHETLDVSFRS